MFTHQYVHSRRSVRPSLSLGGWLIAHCGGAILLGCVTFGSPTHAEEEELASLLIDAAVHSMTGSHSEAEACYRKALENMEAQDTDFLKITIALAAAIENQEGRTGDAARVLVKALDAHRARLGDDHDLIQQMLNSALRMCNAIAWQNSVAPGGSQEQFDIGAEFAQHAAELKLNNSWEWLLGLARLRQGDAKASLDAMQRSLEDSTEDWVGQWFVMAMAEMANGNRPSAMDWYTAASLRMGQTPNSAAIVTRMKAEAADKLGLDPDEPTKERPAPKQLKSLDRLVAGYPEVIPLVVTRALAGLKAGNLKTSESDIKSAIKLVSRRIAETPDETALLRQRGDLQARLGQWKKAAKDFEAALDPESSNSFTWLQMAPILVMTGDREGYVRFCHRMIERFRDSTVNNDFERAIKVSLLIPNAVDLSEMRVADLERALKGEGVEPWNLGWGWACLALVEVRRGNPDAALKCIEEAAKTPDYANTPVEQALCLIVKTLALQDLDRNDEAREAYEQATKLFDVRLASEHDVLIVEILRKEAEERFK